MKPINDINDPRIVKALAHPTRVAILQHLEDGIASPKELAGHIGLSVENVSYHVRMLADLGIIELARETPRRGAIEHHYRARPRPKVNQRAWSGAPKLAQDAATAATLQSIADSLKTAGKNGSLNTDDSTVMREALRLDEEGAREVSGILAQALEDCRAAQKRSAKRAGDDGTRTTVALMHIADETSATREPAA